MDINESKLDFRITILTNDEIMFNFGPHIGLKSMKETPDLTTELRYVRINALS